MLSGEPWTTGSGDSVPTNVDCATPAAMNSEIPLPIPHLLTNSSSRNTKYEPMNSCETMMTLAYPSPYCPMILSLGSRKP